MTEIDQVKDTIEDVMRQHARTQISKESATAVFNILAERIPDADEIVIDVWRDYCMTAHVLMPEGSHLIAQLVREEPVT